MCLPRRPPGTGFLLGYSFGLGLFGSGVNWLYISIHQFGGVGLPGALLLTVLFVGYLSLYPALAAYCVCRLGPPDRTANLILFAPATWVVSEWLRTWVFTGFPWLHLGYSQTDSVLGNVAPIGGVFATSWLVALNAGLLAVLCTRDTSRAGRVGCLCAMLCVIGVSWQLSRLQWASDSGRSVSVALVQGAVPQDIKWRDDLRRLSLDRYLGLTRPLWGTDLIVWPETALPAFTYQITDLLQALTARAGQSNTDLYVGLPYKDLGSGRYYNSLFLLRPAQEHYDKRHLVPFGEFLPFSGVLGNLLAFLQIPMSNFSPGDDLKPVLTGSHATVGVSICYEAAFGNEITAALPDAELLINISNDAWFGDSAAPHQHLQMARFRALESSRYMLRAANTGISALIDQRGTIRASSRQFVPEVVRGKARIYSGLTPYARYGDLPILLLTAGLAFLIRLWNPARRARVE